VTAPVAAGLTAEDHQQRTVRQVRSRLRRAAEQLRLDPSPTAVRTWQQTIDDAERALGSLVHDPWEPSVRPVREAREILGSHLLAAAACEAAAVAPAVTAGVLCRGADSARQALARLDHGVESDRPV
jgi:hypothetical protein